MTECPQDFLVADFEPQVELDPATTCLVLVDLQYATGCRTTGLGRMLAAQGREAEVAYRFERIETLVTPNSVLLLEAFRAAGMRRVFLTYGSEVSDYSDLGPQLQGICRATNNRVGEREHEILDELKPRPDERVVNKLSNSAFQSSELGYLLHIWGCRTLVFCGVSTNMCVEGTLRDARDLGYDCVLAEDATGCDSQAFQDAACAVLARQAGVVLPTAGVLERLGAGVVTA
jgi:nicotinamidase-related amidase